MKDNFEKTHRSLLIARRRIDACLNELEAERPTLAPVKTPPPVMQIDPDKFQHFIDRAGPHFTTKDFLREFTEVAKFRGRRAATIAARILRADGFVSGALWVNGRSERRWSRVANLNPS